MAFQEKSLRCVECGKTFPFTVEEQEFYASKGYIHEPSRCTDCRAKRNPGRNAQTERTRGPVPRQMYPAVCAACGKKTEVPFQPRANRPVYCRDCYFKKKPRI